VKFNQLSKLKLGVAPLVMGAAIMSAPAYAQDSADDVEASEPTAIVVTGSRIARPELDSTTPLTVVSGESLFQTGKVSVGDILNQMPQLRNSFNQQNSTASLGTSGLNLLDLRGLGISRTLVLVNGRRHVASDVLASGVATDINSIPTDLIERADIVTGGNSAVYGSDAIAGVVNFIMKRNFEGVQLRAQTGLNLDHGNAGNQYVSVTAGTNFADGRGNIAVNAEYSHQSDYYASGRGRTFRENSGFVTVDSDPAGSPNGSDGIPDRLFYRDIRSTTISAGGLVPIYQGAEAGCGNDAVGNIYGCTYLFQPNGSLVAQTGERVGLGPNGNFVGGNGYNSRSGRLIALSPELNRYSVNLLAHFEVSPAFEPFIEAKYVRTDVRGSQSGPMFSQGTTLGDGPLVNRERVRLDNPYLSTQARDLLTEKMLASTVNVNSGATFADIEDGPTAAEQLQAQRDGITDGSFRFNVRRNWEDFGLRDEEMRRETYRAVVGVRGQFNDGWNYEVSANYGEHKERNRIKGNVNLQRFLLAIDSVYDPTLDRIVCRSQIDPSAAIGYVDEGATLANDIASCVPLNPFGQGSVDKAARDYVVMDTLAKGKISQFVAGGFVSGQLFELPGGPVGFSVGAEYRRETLSYDLDEMTQAGYAFYNAIPSFRAPSFEVKEVYGELRLPILADKPFAHELTLSGAGRIADYKGSTGTVYAYSGGLDWAPVRDVRFRASYARSIRAPNLAELYSAQGQNYASAPSDPCSLRNIGSGSATRAANCLAAGVPTTYDKVYTSSIEVISGGNPALNEEQSTSWTAGVQLTPSFIPGLILSADYFDIKVKNVIASVSAQEVMDLCYDSPTLDNYYCGLFERNGSTEGPKGEIPYQILQGSLFESSANFASMRARGVDTNLSYRRNFDWGNLSMGAVWTRMLQRDDFTNPQDPGYADRILGELNDPKNRVNLNASVTVGKATFGYQMRWIDKMYLNNYEDVNPLNGQPPQNADYAEVTYYPDVSYHDFRFGLEVNDKFNLYAGVDNVFDKVPPYGLTGVGGGSGIYDARGRYGYIGIRAKL
jgi:outer membrane receptor protein involved in Fe transport